MSLPQFICRGVARVGCCVMFLWVTIANMTSLLGIISICNLTLSHSKLCQYRSRLGKMTPRFFFFFSFVCYERFCLGLIQIFINANIFSSCILQKFNSLSPLDDTFVKYAKVMHFKQDVYIKTWSFRLVFNLILPRD